MSTLGDIFDAPTEALTTDWPDIHVRTGARFLANNEDAMPRVVYIHPARARRRSRRRTSSAPAPDASPRRSARASPRVRSTSRPRRSTTPNGLPTTWPASSID